MESWSIKLYKSRGGLFPIIILAAGSSTRLGQSKQLVLVDGEPLLHKTTRAAIETKSGPVIVVLGSEAERHQTVIADLPVNTIVNLHWKTGIGSSIKTGLHFISKTFPDSMGVIISVSDQPKLTTNQFKQLIKKFNISKSKLIASKYVDTVGVPALFNRSLFPEIQLLKDDEGAKRVIQHYLDEASTVDFPEGSVDLDTPQDLEAFKSDSA